MKQVIYISLFLLSSALLCRFQAVPRPYPNDFLKKIKTYTDSCEELYEEWIGNTDSVRLTQAIDSLIQFTISVKPDGSMACDTLLSDVYRVLSRIYTDTGQEENSRKANLKALDLRKRHFKGKDVKVSRIYHNIGLTYFNFDLDGPTYFKKAICYGDSSYFSYPDANPFNRFYYRNLMMLGLAYFYQGDAFTGNQYLTDALKASEKALDTNNMAEIYRYMSDCYREVGQYRLAIQAAKKGIQLLNSFPDRDSNCLADCYMNLGNALQDSALVMRTPSLFKRSEDSLKLALLIYLNNDSFSASAAYANLGELYRRMKTYSLAEKTLAQGIKFTEKINGPTARLRANLKVNLGEVYADTRQYDEALQVLFEAVGLLTAQSQKPESVATLPSLDGIILNKSVLLMALDDIARVYAEQAEEDNLAQDERKRLLEQAAICGDRIVDLVEITRSDYINEAAKRNLSKNVKPILARQFDVNKRLYHLTGKEQYLQKAFDMAENSKYATLLAGLQVQNMDNFPPELQQLKDREGALLRQIAALSNQSDNPSAKGWVDSMKQLRELRDTIKMDYPDYYQLLRRSPVHTLASIRAHLLDSNQTMLSYYRGLDSIYVFWLGRTGYGLQAVASNTATLSRAYDTFYSGVQDTKEDDDLIYETGFDLYQTLIKPVESKTAPRLVIVPDESFVNLPFEALPYTNTSVATNKLNQRRSSILLFRYSISYAFSAGLLWEMKNKQIYGNKGHSLACFLPTFQKPLKKTPTSLQNPIDSLDVSPPRTEEVKRIAEHVVVHKYEQREASKRNFWNSCKNYTAVHVATHGYLEKTNPQLNFILFDQGQDTLQTDEILYIQDLYTHLLNIEFAFLSACKTSLGKLMDGEGQFSMAHGLAYSGVKSFITTLWSVNTNKTGELAPLFYQYLADGKTKDEALTAAKQAFIQSSSDNADPCFWAGLTLTGDTAPLVLEKPFHLPIWVFWGAGILFIGLSLATIFQRRQAALDLVKF